MKKWLLVLISAIFGGIIVFLILHKHNSKPELVLYGNVDVRLVDMGFRVAGRVEKLFFEEGDVVKTDDLLAVLDRTPYDSEVQQAEANVEVVQANLKNAEILLKRRRELIGVGGVSQEDLDNAEANFNELSASFLQAKAALQVQKDNLEYINAWAPTEGVILTRIREPGTVVNPGDPVYTISVASPVWIRAYAAEPDLGKIYFGMPAEIYTDSNEMYKGYVGFISPVAEFTPKTVQTTQLRTDLVYRLRVYAENPDWHLKQGMPVTVKLRYEPR